MADGGEEIDLASGVRTQHFQAEKQPPSYTALLCNADGFRGVKTVRQSV